MISQKPLKNRAARGALVLWVFLLYTGPVAAQTAEKPGAVEQALDDMPIPEVSEITLGAGLKYEPDYVGSDDYKIRPNPVIYIRFKDILTLDEDGAAIKVVGLSNFSFGPVIHITGPRRAAENPALKGSEDIGRSLDLGLFGQVVIADRFRSRVRYYGAVLGGDNGDVLEFSVRTALYDEKDLSLSLKLTWEVINQQRAMRFFGVSAAQSAVTGLPVYDLDGSFPSAQSEMKARWKFSDHWALYGYARYSRLMGDVARSPLVDPEGAPNQFLIGSYLTHSFTFQ